jgi:CBS domain containing-hemolysin-like protein
MNYAIAVAVMLLLGLLTLVSYVDRLYAEIGKFLSREFQDNIDTFEQEVEPRLGMSRDRAALSMAVLAQMCTAAIAMLVGFSVFRDRAWTIHEILQATLTLILIIIIFQRFLPFVFFSRTKGRWLKHWALFLKILIYTVLPVTLVLGFLQSVASLTKEHADEKPETQAEAVDALIEAGQEEGILDESNRDLIQSVVEFSEKTVRDAMKARPDIVAVPTNTTVEQFIELLKNRPYSRVPVYEGTIHNVKGVVHAQDVLQVPDTEARSRTVDTLMRKDVYFVPESKSGADLLREMQRNNIRMAMVVDEYGGVAGLVTIEDLIEEIVGEIGDEHETGEVVRESEHSYVVPGNMDVDRLDELFGMRPEGKESATIAGLVSELAGRIPQRGEVVEEDGLRFEVLQSTERRVERVRVSVVQPRQMKLIE